VIGLLFGRKAGPKARMLLIVCGLILGGSLVGMTGCATRNATPAAVPTTPAGTYPVTITAQQVGYTITTRQNGHKIVYGSQNQISAPFTINVTVQ
jgi:ABC-type Fe3+-hydroxamate transport system substrate-binding protein